MRKKLIAFMTTFAVMVVMLMPMPVMAASSGGALVKQVKIYSYSSTAKKWQKSGKDDYTYNGAYPSEYTQIRYGDESLSTHTIKYKMKKGLPKSAKHINSIKRNDAKWTYDSKGRITKSVYGGLFNKRKIERKYVYNKQGFVNKYDYKYSYQYPGEKKESSKTTYNYNYTISKGLPKTMESTEVEYYSDNTTYTSKRIVSYNSNGLITKMQYLGSDGTPSDYYYTVKYKTKKGKVTQAIVSYTYNGKTDPQYKYIFNYGKTKISKARAANMINSYVEISNGFGVYNWF